MNGNNVLWIPDFGFRINVSVELPDIPLSFTVESEWQFGINLKTEPEIGVYKRQLILVLRN
jgi:hypothetical protein